MTYFKISDSGNSRPSYFAIFEIGKGLRQRVPLIMKEDSWICMIPKDARALLRIEL